MPECRLLLLSQLLLRVIIKVRFLDPVMSNNSLCPISQGQQTLTPIWPAIRGVHTSFCNCQHPHLSPVTCQSHKYLRFRFKHSSFLALTRSRTPKGKYSQAQQNQLKPPTNHFSGFFTNQNHQPKNQPFRYSEIQTNCGERSALHSSLDIYTHRRRYLLCS